MSKHTERIEIRKMDYVRMIKHSLIVMEEGFDFDHWEDEDIEHYQELVREYNAYADDYWDSLGMEINIENREIEQS